MKRDRLLRMASATVIMIGSAGLATANARQEEGPPPGCDGGGVGLDCGLGGNLPGQTCTSYHASCANNTTCCWWTHSGSDPAQAHCGCNGDQPTP
jgi:hypothetical protein